MDSGDFPRCDPKLDQIPGPTTIQPSNQNPMTRMKSEMGIGGEMAVHISIAQS